MGSVCRRMASGQVENEHLGAESPAVKSAACAASTEWFQLTYFTGNLTASLWGRQWEPHLGNKGSGAQVKRSGRSAGKWDSGLAR